MPHPSALPAERPLRLAPLAALLLLAAALAAAPTRAADTAPLGPPPTEVILIPHAKVDHTFTTGGALHLNTRYKVQAGRRITNGNVEVHTYDTDIFYVVAGEADFLTGGTAQDTKETGPGEIRGKSILGGTARHLSKGDIIIIPPGIPHQFTKVDGEFLYYVIKVTR